MEDSLADTRGESALQSQVTLLDEYLDLSDRVRVLDLHIALRDQELERLRRGARVRGKFLILLEAVIALASVANLGISLFHGNV